MLGTLKGGVTSARTGRRTVELPKVPTTQRGEGSILLVTGGSRTLPDGLGAPQVFMEEQVTPKRTGSGSCLIH